MANQSYDSLAAQRQSAEATRQAQLAEQTRLATENTAKQLQKKEGGHATSPADASHKPHPAHKPTDHTSPHPEYPRTEIPNHADKNAVTSTNPGDPYLSRLEQRRAEYEYQLKHSVNKAGIEKHIKEVNKQIIDYRSTHSSNPTKQSEVPSTIKSDMKEAPSTDGGRSSAPTEASKSQKEYFSPPLAEPKRTNGLTQVGAPIAKPVGDNSGQPAVSTDSTPKKSSDNKTERANQDNSKNIPLDKYHQSKNDADRFVSQASDQNLPGKLKALSPSERGDLLTQSTGPFKERLEKTIQLHKLETIFNIPQITVKAEATNTDIEQTPAGKAAREVERATGVDLQKVKSFTLIPNPISPDIPPQISLVEGEGYAYKSTFRIAKANEFVDEKTVMQLVQSDPDKIFPFRVVTKSGEEQAVIKEGVVLDLQGARHPIDNGNYVRVENVTQTQFTFRTLPGHFDGPNALISFSTFQKDGYVFLQQEAWAPKAGRLNAQVNPYGAVHHAWKLQAENLIREVPKLDPLYPLRPLMPTQPQENEHTSR